MKKLFKPEYILLLVMAAVSIFGFLFPPSFWTQRSRHECKIYSMENRNANNERFTILFERGRFLHGAMYTLKIKKKHGIITRKIFAQGNEVIETDNDPKIIWTSESEDVIYDGLGDPMIELHIPANTIFKEFAE